MIDPLTGEWVPGVEGQTKLRVFDGMNDFYSAITELGIMFIDPLIDEFNSAYMNQAGGCGCTKKKRRKMAISRYLDLKHLQGSSKVRLKAELNTRGIQLMHEGEIFADWYDPELE